MEQSLVTSRETTTGRVRAYYVLVVLMLAYACAYIDRSVIGVLLPAIRHEFAMSDTTLGFLSGFAFAGFFILLGIPVAVWADRGNRRTLIALSIGLWSAMTTASGIARTFPQLVLARMGVGIGEAGLTPAAHSLISDLFAPRARAFALSIYSGGVYLGILLGLAVGGLLAQRIGWRDTFIAVGLPGLVIAALIALTINEPERGRADGFSVRNDYSGLGSVLALLWRERALRYTFFGIALCAMVNQTQMVWLPSFLHRVHAMPIREAGLILGLVNGMGGFCGTILGGRFSDALGARDARWRLWVVTVAMLVSPLVILLFLFAGSTGWLIVAAAGAAITGAIHLAPTTAVIQNLTPLRMRARMVAIILFVLNLLGLGVGPLIVGMLSDHLRPILGEESLRFALIPMIGFALLAAGVYFVAGKAYGAAEPVDFDGDLGRTM